MNGNGDERALPSAEGEDANVPPLARRWRKFGAELLGTFFVTIVPTAVDILYYEGKSVDYVSRWLARGFITTSVIYALSAISGAHVDPAVSLGFALRRALSVRGLLWYTTAQFIGGFAATGLAFAAWHAHVILGASRPGPGVPYAEAFEAECVLSFLLVFVILATAEEEATVGKNAAIAVGLCVAACGFIGGPISGASMNPARSIPPQIAGGAYGLIWIYALGPPVGAALAALAIYTLIGPAGKAGRRAGRGT